MRFHRKRRNTVFNSDNEFSGVVFEWLRPVIVDGRVMPAPYRSGLRHGARSLLLPNSVFHCASTVSMRQCLCSGIHPDNRARFRRDVCAECMCKKRPEPRRNQAFLALTLESRIPSPRARHLSPYRVDDGGRAAVVARPVQRQGRPPGAR